MNLTRGEETIICLQSSHNVSTNYALQLNCLLDEIKANSTEKEDKLNLQQYQLLGRFEDKICTFML